MFNNVYKLPAVDNPKFIDYHLTSWVVDIIASIVACNRRIIFTIERYYLSDLPSYSFSSCLFLDSFFFDTTISSPLISIFALCETLKETIFLGGKDDGRFVLCVWNFFQFQSPAFKFHSVPCNVHFVFKTWPYNHFKWAVMCKIFCHVNRNFLFEKWQKFAVWTPPHTHTHAHSHNVDKYHIAWDKAKHYTIIYK